jgi:predicted RNA-binding Zn-ribbon protein involved in translation (DUF1610 family)
MEICEAIGRMRAVADGPTLAGADAAALRILLDLATRATTLVKCETCDKGVRWRHAVKGMCPDCAAGAIDRLSKQCDALAAAARLADEFLDGTVSYGLARQEKHAIRKAFREALAGLDATPTERGTP